MEILRFVLFGLAAGSVTAVLAQALVLTYRASGVLNLAQSSFLMLGAYSYYQLHEWGLPLLVAMVGAVGLSGVLGALVYVIVIKPLENSAPLTKVVATLGVLVVSQSAVVLYFGLEILAVPSWLPNAPIELSGGATIGLDRILIFFIGIAAAVSLWAIYRFSSFGQVSSAVAENPRVVASLGHSPARIAAMNWAFGAAIAGFAGTMAGPLVFLLPTPLILMIVPALAAAVIGGFRSFAVSLTAALVIGVAQSLMQRYSDVEGVATAVPFLLVALWLVLRGRSIPLRSHVLERLPAVGSGRIRPVPTVLVAIAAYALVFTVVSPTSAPALNVTFAAGLICLSIVVITGFAGQLSLAQYVMAGFSAFLALKLPEHMPIPLAIAVAVVVTAVLGAILAVPSLRTRGTTLAVVTLALATVVYDSVLNNAKVNGGQPGLPAPYPLTIFGLDIDPIMYPERYGAVVLTVLILACLMVANLRRGMVGRRLLAVRGNERAAAALGISVPVAKLYAFAVGAGIAAVAGVLMAYQQVGVLVSLFDPFTSMVYVGMTVAGGVGMVGGALIGATMISGGFVSSLLDEHAAGINAYVPLAGGIILLMSLRVAPDGIFEDLRSKLAALAAHLRSGRDTRRMERAHDAVPQRVADADEAAQRATARAALPPLGEVSTLRVQDLTVRFGGVVALDHVSLELKPGEVHGLIGPNGAGKTTLIDAISGFVAMAEGEVSIDDERIERRSPHARARKGVIRSFQSVDLFDDLTVRENIAVASDHMTPWRYLTDLFWPARATMTAQAREAIEVCELGPYLDLKPGELPFGVRRMVGIARALSSAPAVLLLDEPAAGLGDVEATELGILVRAVADRGVAVLLVEHRVDLIAEHCDVVTVLQSGRHLAHGEPAEVLTRAEVLTAYLGAAPAEDEPAEVTARS